MTLRKRFPAVLAAIIFLASALWAQEAVTVHPQDTGTALENPGMGWVFHHYDNNIAGYGPPLGPGYAGTDFPGLTVCYLRLPWAYLEPEEGRFDWSVVDTPAQRYIAAGRQIAFRFTCCESGLKYATPEWVRKAGAKGYEWENGKLWEPDYDDPIYLQKLEKFLAAAGARYDGSPHVAFVDIGTSASGARGIRSTASTASPPSSGTSTCIVSTSPTRSSPPETTGRPGLASATCANRGPSTCLWRPTSPPIRQASPSR
jgi:hypothetical protein